MVTSLTAKFVSRYKSPTLPHGISVQLQVFYFFFKARTKLFNLVLFPA